MLSIFFAFASCKKNDENHKQESSTISTTENKNTTKEEPTKSDETAVTVDESLTGTWIYDETVTPQNFYTDFYNPEITQTNIELRTTYEFNGDGTFSIGISIINISEVRTEYRALMVAAARKNVESQGKMLTPDEVLYYENYADDILEAICTAQEGTYVIEGNRIVYTSTDDSFYETFALNGNKLTLTGSSASSEGYPVTMTKMK